MADDVLTLSGNLNGEDVSIDLFDVESQLVLRNGTQVGDLPERGPQVLTYGVRISSPSVKLTPDELEAKKEQIDLLLASAGPARYRGRGRNVVLTAQPKGLTKASKWDVLGGRLSLSSPWDQNYGANGRYVGTLMVQVEPGSRTDAVNVFTSKVSGLGAGINLGHVATGAGAGDGAFTNTGNVAMNPDGELFRKDVFTTTPAASQAAAANVARYFGCSHAAFTELYLTVRVAAVWSVTGTGAWEYWNGSAWTAVVPLIDPFTTGSPWDTLPDHQPAAIVFPPLTGIVSKTINATPGYFVRWRQTGGTMTTQPVINGAAGSDALLGVIPKGFVPGNLPADLKLKIVNNAATVIGGFLASIWTGRQSSAPPAYILPWAGSDLGIISGDNTATLVADANAAYKYGVDVALGVVLSDRAQTFNGVDQMASVAIASGDKIDSIASSEFLIEVMFKPLTVPGGPVPLVSRWNTTNQDWWLGIDGGKLRALFYNSAGTPKKKILNGVNNVEVGEWQIATLEYRRSKQRARLYKDTGQEAEIGSSTLNLRSGNTTALNVAHSAGFSTVDSKSGSDSEGYFNGSIGYIWIEARNADTIFSVGHYPSPDTKRTTEGYANVASSTTRGYWEFDDTDGTNNLVDTATAAGAAKTLVRTGAPTANNNAANTGPGPFLVGVTTAAKVLSRRIPLAYGLDWAGQYHVYLTLTTPALTNLDDLTFALQFGPGDIKLPLHIQAVTVPTKEAPTARYLLDMGSVTLPQQALAGQSLKSAYNHLRADLYITFSAAATVRMLDLILLPTDTLHLRHDGFRDSTGYTQAAIMGVAQNEAFVVDMTGPEPIIEYADTGGDLRPNDYALPIPARARIQPRAKAWIMAGALRPSTTGTDHLEVSMGDALDLPLVSADIQPRAEVLHAP